MPNRTIKYGDRGWRALELGESIGSCVVVARGALRFMGSDHRETHPDKYWKRYEMGYIMRRSDGTEFPLSYEMASMVELIRRSK